MYSSAAATQFGLYDAGTAGGGTGGGICTATGGFYAASTGEDGGGGFYAAAGGTPTFFTSSQNIFPNADFLVRTRYIFIRMLVCLSFCWSGRRVVGPIYIYIYLYFSFFSATYPDDFPPFF